MHNKTTLRRGIVLAVLLELSAISGCALLVGPGGARWEPPMTGGCIGLCFDRADAGEAPRLSGK